MMRGDPDFADNARALIEVGRALDEPSRADRERVRARLTAVLGAPSAFAAPHRSAADSGASAGPQCAPSGLTALKLVSSLGLALALTTAGAGLFWTWRSAPDPQPSALRASLPEPAAKPATATAAPTSSAATSMPNAGEPMRAAQRSAKAAAALPAVFSRRRSGFERRELGRASDTHGTANMAALSARTTHAFWEAESSTNTGASALGVATRPASAHANRPTDAPRAAATNALPTPAVAHPDAPQAAATNALPTPTVAHPDAPRAAAATPPSMAGELALLDAAQRALARGELQRALTQLDQHTARYPSGSLVPERSAARAVTLCRMQRRGEGLLELQRLQARASSSPLLAWARESCGVE
jgi:hypothetical protein